MKVLKFGGTTVGSVSNILTLIDTLAVESKKEKPVVVLSAMSGVTDALASLADAAAAGLNYEDKIRELEHRHTEVAKELLIGQQLEEIVLAQLDVYFYELRRLLQHIQSLREVTPKTRDLVLSYGERCATYLVSKVAELHFQGALFVDASTLIKTDSSFGHARVNTELTNQLIRSFYQENKDNLLFVTGFIASDNHGQLTTLGRGGSDYTAALLGSALNCSEIQIWTDVNGMMTADPKMVKKAIPLTELSYTEAMELSYFGARVIYPPSMTPAFLKKIPIVIRNITNPAFPGTVIQHDTQKSSSNIKGISSVNDTSIINLQGSGMVGKAGYSGRLFSLLSREQINVILITQASSEHSITFAVNPADAVKAKQLIEQEFELELQAEKLETPTIEQDLSVLAIVGENMKETPGISGKLFHALGRNGINVRAIAQGSSEYNISVIILKEDLRKALNTVHDAFFTELKKTLHVFCLGTGNISKTLIRQLQEHHTYLQQHNGIQVKLMGVSNSRRMVFDADGIPLDSWQQVLEVDGEQANLQEFVNRMQLMNLPNCVLADNTASPAPISFYEEVFRSNISIVTCNKIGNSSDYQQYKNFKDTALQHGVDFYYETNVGAGLPIVRTLKDLMMSGDRVLRIEAILSGTISFIFNNFKGNASFHDVVKLAQEKGFTEPDPRDDLSGLDFMRKMLILARDAGYPLEASDVQIENILPPSCLQAANVPEFYAELKAAEAYFVQMKEKAEKSGSVLRYIGSLEDGQVKISLQMVDESHPFYTLSGSDNIISFTTDRYKERPMVVKGPGAGAEVTAAGVFADIVNVGSH
ncbi:bifunctional aspartate kinase/homoserine dehydrogenase I [Pontibacter diazotrophicus]|uniref:Bifunctional aspartate kinase/homoserine dehydrogenase I n=1 Tax=Pontibacter diazotrophicus TaxID=1400979 RepID=A0A3D8LHM8_9BACT|nr:bifunctional aspartate kinase/homoserine dehydrogenase I [Pontibacter diazotrophicus]RDV16940.1 bifunctional aspartate kinase/homoserine dehydrogenase I [Pontibacter diazotrophicus]